MDRPTFEAIEAYVLDRMTAAERSAFEQRMADDPALREEVELERENIQAVELGGLSRMLKGIAQEAPTEEREASDRARLLKYAAMVAAIVTCAIWWMSRTPLNEQLYAEHFTPDAGLPVAMGTTSDPAFADAMVAYKLGDYDEARTKWAPILVKEPANDTLRYYIASAWLAENNTAQAIPLLEDLVREPGSTFSARSQWFLFLAYVRSGQTAEARAMPLETDPAYGDRVRAIKAELAR